MSKPRVFVAERPRNEIDLTKAESFGEVVCLSEHSERRLSAYESTEYMTRMEALLREYKFDPDRDFFCVVGPVLPVSLVMSLLSLKHAVVSILCYNVSLQRYVQRTVDTRRLRDEGSDSEDRRATTASS